MMTVSGFLDRKLTMGWTNLRHYSRRRRFPHGQRAHRHGFQVAVHPWGSLERVNATISNPKSTLQEVFGGSD